MGKAANSKRRAIFEELESNGKIPPMRRRKRTTPVVQHPYPWCCLVKYGKAIPESFVPCIDCPLDNDDRKD